jgi:hypothetical protein
MKYETPEIKILLFSVEDIITTSDEKEWEDENVNDNGWL